MTGILTSLKNILSAAGAITAQQLGADGQKVVSDAVHAAESLGGSGAEKFSAAISKAGSDLLALGKDCSLYVLHLAVESAVTAMNAPQITAAVNAVATPSPSPTATPAAAAPVVPQAAATAPVITGQALTNAVANVQAGSPIATEAANLVSELRGQGVTTTLAQAQAAIQAALPTTGK